MHGGQWWRHLPGQIQIVKSNDGKFRRDIFAYGKRLEKSAEGNHVISANERGRRIGLFKKDMKGLTAFRNIVRSFNQQARFKFQPAVGKCVANPVDPIGGAVVELA